MNNKGFTLIELLVTLGLIAIISTIIVVNMNSMQTKETSAEYTQFKDQLTTAGCSFIDANINDISRVKCKNGATCQVPISSLIAEGLVDGDTIDPNTNVKLSEEQDKYYINVIWVDNNGYKEKQCTLTETQDGDTTGGDTTGGDTTGGDTTGENTTGGNTINMPSNTTAAPICKKPVVPTDVQIDDVTITYGCDASSVDGCMSPDETKTYKETTKETLKWTIEDYYNLKTECSYDVNITIDTTEPSIIVNANPLSLGNGDYNFVDNVIATFGPAGGTVTCSPVSSQKTGTYNVTCVADPNNHYDSESVTFAVRHSYTGTYHYVSKTCSREYNCGNRNYCNGSIYTCDQLSCDPDGSCKQLPSACCSTGWYSGYGCNYEDYDCSYSYYSCPNGGTLSGTTCYY